MNVLDERPITVQVTRTVDIDSAHEVDAWVSRGQAIMLDFPGYLGSGLVRDSAASDTWRMLYRFADSATLHRWEESEERAAWIAEMAPRFRDETFQHRTGIEGWFDDPVDGDSLRPTAPPRWKQMCVIFLGFFPVSLVANLLLRQVIPADAPLPLTVLFTMVCVMPVMVYLVLPGLTRLFRPWLEAGRS